jgi:prefoldin subunit 5
MSSLLQLGLCEKLPDDPKMLSRRIQDLEAELVLVEADKSHLESTLARLEALYERQELLLNRLERASV